MKMYNEIINMEIEVELGSDIIVEVEQEDMADINTPLLTF